jgi:hypothetical protein
MAQSVAHDFYIYYRPFYRCFKVLFGPFAKSQGQAKAFDHPFEAGCAASVSWSLFARKLRMSGIRSGQSPPLEAAVICSRASARASNILLGDRRARQMAQSLGELDHARVNFLSSSRKVLRASLRFFRRGDLVLSGHTSFREERGCSRVDLPLPAMYFK